MNKEFICVKGLTRFCQGAACGEIRGELPKAQLHAWINISQGCEAKECSFNKIGRDQRTLENDIVSDQTAHAMQIEGLKVHADAWSGIVRS